MTSRKVLNVKSKKDLSKALSFIGEVGIERISCRVTSTTEMVKSLVKKGRVHDANRFICDAQEKGLKLDAFPYSIVINGLCKEGHIEKALDLCAFMENSGILPTVETYNSLINGFCREGCLVEAFRLFNSMEQMNLVPTITTYGTLISCLCGEGFLEDAIKLFERMLSNGTRPNTHTYNSLIYGHATFGLMEECQKYLYDMEMKLLQPDFFTVSAIIHGFCVKGDVGGALQFYYKYRKKAQSPDFFGFYCLIRSLYSRGRVEETRSILRDMLQCQPVADLIDQVENGAAAESLTSFLNILCDQGSIKDALCILGKIGNISFPSARSNVFHRDDLLRRLQDIEPLMSNSMKLPLTIHPLFLRHEKDKNGSWCRSCNFEDTDNLNFGAEIARNNIVMEDYKMLNSVPHDFHTYYSIISSLCSKGELYEARKLVKMMIIQLKSC